MKVLVTGGAGFVGVHLVQLLLTQPHVTAVTVLDCYRHTATPQAVPAGDRVQVVQGDLLDGDLLADLVTGCDVVFHLAAETFVDASIADDRRFVETNIGGTAMLLRALRQVGGRQLVHVSTDEVFGESDGEPFTEQSPYRPRNPYAATKAGADHLVRSYIVTHGLDARIVHCGNLFGRWQYPEKLIPVTVSRLLRGEAARIYGSGHQSRTWLHVSDAAAGLLAALEHGHPGESYLIAGDSELTTLDMVRRIAELAGVPAQNVIRHVPDRPGHDHRYAIDTTKARRDLGWKPQREFDSALEDTVHWLIDNDGWWQK